MGVSDFFCHARRYTSNGDDDLLCPCCRQPEDEEHVLFDCPGYERFRPWFLKCEKEMYRIKFPLELSYTKGKCCALAWYLFKALKLRRTMTDT